MTVVIGDNDSNKMGGVGELSALQSNWPVLVSMWAVVKDRANFYTLPALSG